MATVTISWKITINKILADHKEKLLANMKRPFDLVNFDLVIRSPRRFGVDPTEKRLVLLGRIPYVSPGLKFDIRGDRNRDGRRALYPMEDGEVVHDVLPLGNVLGDYKVLFELWNNQIEVIEALEADEEKRIDDTPIMDAPLRFLSLIKEDRSREAPRDKLEILWNKFETIDEENAGRLVQDKHLRNVTKGALYPPTVLENGKEPFCLMKKDAIRQHDIQDEHGHLIPPWEMANEIRPGSIMIVVAAIWEVNTPIVNSKEGYFERRYELRGRWAQVLRRGNGHPSLQSPPFLHIHNQLLVSSELALVRQRVLTDFEGFKIKEKRKKNTRTV